MNQCIVSDEVAQITLFWLVGCDTSAILASWRGVTTE